MTNLTTEEMQRIVDGAPEGATHHSFSIYYKITDIQQIYSLGRWIVIDDVDDEIYHLNDNLNDLRTILAQQQEIERLRNPWISVADELPEPDELCLVHFGDPEIEPEFDYMDTEVDFGTQFWANHGEDVTHWMPSPQPPKGESDE